MQPDLFVSTQSQPDLTITDGRLGPSWQHVGRIGPDERALWKSIGPHIGQTGSGAGARFYAACDPDAPWVADMLTRHPGLKHGGGTANVTDRFWLAFDLRRYFHRYLFTIQQAKIAAIGRNPTPAHPGIFGVTVPIPIQVTAKAGEVFTRVETS